MLADLKLDGPQRTHIEVTYVNRIEAGSLTRLLSKYASLPVNVEGVAALPEWEKLTLQYPVSIDESPVGRLYVEASPGIQNTPNGPTESYRLVLAFRAPSLRANEIEADMKLFQRGRVAIVQMFAALTHEDDHKKWGRFK